MDAFTANYLSDLAAALTDRLMAAVARRTQEALSPPEAVQALNRAVTTAIAALLSTAITSTEAEHDLLADLFRDFLTNPDVAQELTRILRGDALDMAYLATLFQCAGYDAETLPGLDFERGIAVFKTAFLAAAAEEPALQGAIQAGNLLAQTGIQRDLLAEMRELAAFLRKALPGSIGIKAGTIKARNVVNGPQITFQLSAAPAGTLSATDWETHYLRTLLAECGELDFAPLDETRLQTGQAGDPAAVSITDVFTTLYLQEISRRRDEPIAVAVAAYLARAAGQSAGEAEQPERDGLRVERAPVSAVEAVSAARRLVILGEPGGGKSTLVNYLTVELAQRRLNGPASGKGDLPGWPAGDSPLPVRIVLRRFAAWLPAGGRGEVGEVWAYLEHRLKQWGCGEALGRLKAILVRGDGIIFFDGLDEVSETDAETKRSRIVRAVRQFAGQLENCRVVVTSRTYAYRRGDAWRLPENRFPVVTLDLFQPEQIRAFTRTWYQVVGPSKGWDAAKCRLEADRLYEATEQLPHLQDLARYPLLLTLMAHLHGVDGSLPNDRADLYRRAVDLLLARWDNRVVRDAATGEQKVEPGLVMRLGVRTEQLAAALQRVACAALERQETDRHEEAGNIPRVDLLDELKAELGSLDRAEMVIEYVQNRAGLLQDRGGKMYAFPHRTFQEYLAALHLLKDADPVAALCGRARRETGWWREVFLLAAASSRQQPSTIAALAENLAPGTPAGALPPVELVQLAGTMLAETGFAGLARREKEEHRFYRVYQGVLNWHTRAMIAETVPAVVRAAVGETLAQLGDPRPGVTRVREITGSDGKTVAVPWLALEEVPAGPFLLGANEADKDAFANERPQHPVALPAFRITRYPITNAQYGLFMEAGGYNEERWWTPGGWAWRNGAEADLAVVVDEELRKNYAEWLAGRPLERRGEPFFWGDSRYNRANQPVVGVTWYEAMAYCAWLNGQSAGWEIRLPTEAEWEKAAGWDFKRGRKLRYPWGDEWDENKANIDRKIGRPTAVGMYPAGVSPCGAMDMAGNIWEWTLSSWGSYDFNNPGFRYPFQEGTPRTASGQREGNDTPGFRVVRGGSWNSGRRLARVSFRDANLPDDFGSTIGFRLMVSPNL